MDIKISGLENLNRALNARLRKLEPAFREGVTIEKERIQDRTQSGLGANNRKFRPYSERWAEVRASKGLPTSYVDLTFSGAMFNAFRISFSKKEGLLRGILNFGSEGWKVKRNQDDLGREFFRLTKSQIENIKTKLRQAS